MSKIRILIADDMPHVAEYYKMIMEGEKEFEVVGIANSGKEAYELSLKLIPDIILMDIQMEIPDAGIVATQRIKEELPDVKVIMLTSHNDSNSITESFAAGATDFLTTDSSVVEIVSKIKDYSNSKNEIDHIKKALVDELMKLQNENKSLLHVMVLLSRLSKSEMQILHLISQGKTYRQIAEERIVEEVTIRSMVNKIKKKLGLDSLKDITNTLRESDILNKFLD